MLSIFSKDAGFVIEKGNKVYYCVLLFFSVLTILGCLQFKNLEIETCRLCLVNLNILSLLIMTPYRIRLAMDKEHMGYVYPNVKHSWVFELPFFPCNTAEILFGLAIFIKSRMLMGYCFFLGLIGPLLAFCDPPKGFEKGNFFYYKIFGFYTTHYLTLMNIPLLLVSKLFVPNYMDVCKALLFYAILSFVMYFFNRYIDTFNLGCPANYFFNMDPDYHPIFRKVYNIIPYRYLFTIPLLFVTGVVLCVFVFILQFII